MFTWIFLWMLPGMLIWMFCIFRRMQFLLFLAKRCQFLNLKSFEIIVKSSDYNPSRLIHFFRHLVPRSTFASTLNDLCAWNDQLHYPNWIIKKRLCAWFTSNALDSRATWRSNEIWNQNKIGSLTISHNDWIIVNELRWSSYITQLPS